MNKDLHYGWTQPVCTDCWNERNPDEHIQLAWRCRSGQCYAGWTATISGAQWLTENPGSLVAHYVVVPDDEDTPDWMKRDIDRFTAEYADAYGESREHVGKQIVEVAYWAQYKLGVTSFEANRLFNGQNSREVIAAYVKAIESQDPDLFEEADKLRMETSNASDDEDLPGGR